MKKLQFPKLLLAVAALGAAAALLGLAAAQSASGSAKPSSVRTLQFVSVSQRFAAVPAITKAVPPQLGGRLIFEDLMYDVTP
jgi:hypothetical protein